MSPKKKSPFAPTSMISSVTLMVALSKNHRSSVDVDRFGFRRRAGRKTDAQDTRRPSLQLWSYLFTFLACRPAAKWRVRGAEWTGIYRPCVITVHQIECKLPVPSLPCSTPTIASHPMIVVPNTPRVLRRTQPMIAVLLLVWSSELEVDVRIHFYILPLEYPLALPFACRASGRLKYNTRTVVSTAARSCIIGGSR